MLTFDVEILVQFRNGNEVEEWTVEADNELEAEDRAVALAQSRYRGAQRYSILNVYIAYPTEYIDRFEDDTLWEDPLDG